MGNNKNTRQKHMELKSQKYRISLPSFYHQNDKKKNGYIYVVKIGEYVKVGRAKNLDNRLKVYKSFPPFAYELLLSKKVEDCYFFERAIQKCLLEYQIKGEWFELPTQWTKNPKKGACDILKYVEKQVKLQILWKKT